MCESKQIVCVRFDIVVDTSDIVEATFDIAESIDVVQDDDCLNEVTVVEFIDFDVLDLEESHDTLCP